ncbi:MAG: hypothetical protein WC701_13600 [Kiritimatiellales bacterium]|jgi:hypothetical protein
MARNYETFRLSDKHLLDALTAIASGLAATNAEIAIRFDEQHGQLIRGALAGIGDNADIQQILRSNASLMGLVTLSINNTPYNGCTLRVKRSGSTDSVTIDLRNDLPISHALKFAALVQEQLKPFERDESFDKLLGNELAEFYRKREQGLVKLEELAQRIVEKNEEYRRKLDQEAQATLAQLKEKYEALSKEMLTGYERKDEGLHTRELALENQLQEIDDRSNRHARRQIRKDLKDAIEKRSKEFTLTQKTTRKRIVVHAVFLALIGMLGTLSAYYITHPANAQGVEGWVYLIRLPLLSAGIAAALIYYIRWNDVWFRRHADEEFRTKRFELDVDRASWLVEVALEWKEEKGTEIPRELLDRLSANLFEGATNPSEAYHPSEDLLSALLGASAELNLNVPGVGTVRLDRKGAKQFRQAVENTKQLGDNPSR